MLGTFPVGFQSFEGSPHAFVGDLAGDDPLLEADLGSQFQGPGAAIFAEIARAAVQQLFQLLGSFFREGGAQPMGARRPLAQHGEADGIETVEDVAHGLVVAAQLERNRGGSLSASRSRQNLAATEYKSIGRTQSFLDVLLFIFGQWSDKNGGSHTLSSTTFPMTCGGNALGMPLEDRKDLVHQRYNTLKEYFQGKFPALEGDTHAG